MAKKITSKPSPRKKPAAAKNLAAREPAAKKNPVKLLSGGNPQIAKAVGDAGPAAVRAYIAAMPGWKSALGARLDALIEGAVPGVRKAVKWNSPFYGAPNSAAADPAKGKKQSWFLGIHCFDKYIKIAFFQGAALRPLPPGPSKQKNVRYLDLREHDELDEKQFAAWVRQASEMEGEWM